MKYLGAVLACAILFAGTAQAVDYDLYLYDEYDSLVDSSEYVSTYDEVEGYYPNFYEEDWTLRVTQVSDLLDEGYYVYCWVDDVLVLEDYDWVSNDYIITLGSYDWHVTAELYSGYDGYDDDGDVMIVCSGGSAAGKAALLVPLALALSALVALRRRLAPAKA